MNLNPQKVAGINAKEWAVEWPLAGVKPQVGDTKGKANAPVGVKGLTLREVKLLW
jgi:hypothetical protein